MKTIFIIFCLIFNILYSFEYDLAICAIFRDDAKYLKEWIDFHIKQGVQHFYLYDNFSIDHPEQVLEPYIEKKIVELIDWPLPHEGHLDWLKVQNASYMDCINKNKLRVKWLACIDTDEFLFNVDGKKITHFLEDYEDYQIVMVDWQLFGTSNITCKNGEIIEYLFLRAHEDYNVWTKCIVKPLYTTGCHFSHYFFCKDQTLCVDENKKYVAAIDCSFKKSTVKKIRLNHYFCRDKSFFERVKINRIKKQGRDAEHILRQQEALCNFFLDKSILKALK